MSAANSQPPTPAPLAALPGSAMPSPATVRFVEQWLWKGAGRETAGLPWPDEYVRDAARMLEFVVIHRPPNATALPPGEKGAQ